MPNFFAPYFDAPTWDAHAAAAYSAKQAGLAVASAKSGPDYIDPRFHEAASGAACINLDEDAAYAMLNALDKCHSAITMLENEEHQERWQQALFAVVDNRSCHPVLLGRCNRILYDLEQQDAEQLNNQFRLELSEGNDVTHGAAWLEGLFINGAVLLLYDDKLFELLDTWINQLEEEDFVRVLPMVRRSFSTFSPGELNQLSGRVLYGSNKSSATAYQTDPELAQLALQKLAFYIGLNP